MEDAYPLEWPAGRGRTPFSKRESGTFAGTPDLVRREMVAEIKRMNGLALIISTNIRLRNDGMPYASAKEPEDPGVAVYFQRGKDRVCFACDKYDRVWKNMRAITKTIEAMRGIERWGSKEMLDQAFAGFKALPSPNSTGTPRRSWWVVLGVDRAASIDVVHNAYKEKVRRSSEHDRLNLNIAMDQAREEKA